MLAPHVARLLGGTPAGIDDALGLLDGFDASFVHGLARLDEARTAALAAFAEAFAVTPLRTGMAEATAKVAAGSITDEHVAALAGGRTALLGAVHDALLTHLHASLGRERSAWDPPATSDSAPDGTRAAARAWLRELAIGGWRGVDHDLASAPAPVIAAALAGPGLRRLGVLLDGLMAELRAAAPVSAMPRVPARRWGDLWARAVMLTQDRAATPAPELVSGRLLPLGLEVHEHPTAVRLRLHALLKPTAGAARLLHTGVVLPKVDTIVGPAVWPLARDTPLLLAAIVEHRAVEVVEWPLSAGGHLTWQEDRAELGEPADPFVTARVELPSALAPATAALERHPVAIAEPVLLEGYEAEATAFVFGDHRLAVDVDRLPPAGPLTAPVVAASRACIGLLCWDGGVWSMRPLAVETLVKRKTVATHNSDWALGIKDPKAAKSNAAGADAVPVLRERAGRLLRR